MQKESKTLEKFISELWKNQAFEELLLTPEGETLEILEPGIENRELGGPDFMNARIKIGNITYQGDVEIDTCHNDWRNHGHNLNKKYNKVILHAVFTNNSGRNYVITQDGRRVKSISLEKFLKEDIRASINKAIVSERNNRGYQMPCKELIPLIDENEKIQFLFDLGIDRFKKKREKIIARLKELAYLSELGVREPILKYEFGEDFYNKNFSAKDFGKQELWQQLIMELVFEALGFAKNKDNMLKLARNADINFLRRFGNKHNFMEYIEAALFNVSGLMPDTEKLPDTETSVYTRKLSDLWQEMRGVYDKGILNPAHWHFFQLRPQNFPTIRIAAGARIAHNIIKGQMISKMITQVTEDKSETKLLNDFRNWFIIKGDGYWKNHFIFDQPSKGHINYFVGVSRADEIIVNVILPVLSTYFDIFGKREEANKVNSLYLDYTQLSENSLVKEIEDTLRMNGAGKKSILYQGMLELFRNFCSRSRCLECAIGKKAFD